MTSEEFKERIKKDYLLDKYSNYFFAFSSLLAGFFFLYKLVLTEWSRNLSLSLFTFILILSMYLIYIGIVGFIRTPNLANVDLIINDSNLDMNKNLVLEISKKLNFRLLISENNNILKFETTNLLLEKQDLIFLINSEGIFLNIQQRNWNGPTFIGHLGSIKLKNKIIKLVKDSR